MRAVKVILLIVFVQLLSGPRRPEVYEVSLNLITKSEYKYKQEKSLTVHPIVYDKLEYIMLTLIDGLIQPNNIYTVNISASNSAGSSIIVQNLIISKCSGNKLLCKF